jgi:alkylation response protein AidB-like acyl-CoA dehydrogenase
METMTEMNFEPSPEGRRMLETFQQLRKENVAPRALKHDKAATFPVDTFQDLHREKLLELSIPKEYGGRDRPATPIHVIWCHVRPRARE